MSSPILVIGALGNVGAEVVKQLQAKGRAVRAADINKEKVKKMFGESVDAVYFDFTDPKTYEATFKGVERMFVMRPPHISNIKRDMLPACRGGKTPWSGARSFPFPDRNRTCKIRAALQS